MGGLGPQEDPSSPEAWCVGLRLGLFYSLFYFSKVSNISNNIMLCFIFFFGNSLPGRNLFERYSLQKLNFKMLKVISFNLKM